MSTFASYSVEALSELRGHLRDAAADCATLRSAGERSVALLYQEFEASLALLRLFATLPFAFLPPREQAFARRVAEKRGMLPNLTGDTIVVTLLASRGASPQWNDPGNSRERLAIPLLNAACLEPIPIVGRVLSGAVSDVPWLTKQETLLMRDSMGAMSQLILVADARTTRTSDGRTLVIAQDFVRTNGVRSVLALGGKYLNGTTLALVLFTREELIEAQVSKFTTVINTIKSATMKAVMDCKIL
jgi:hypothetical protein